MKISECDPMEQGTSKRHCSNEYLVQSQLSCTPAVTPRIQTFKFDIFATDIIEVEDQFDNVAWKDFSISPTTNIVDSEVPSTQSESATIEIGSPNVKLTCSQCGVPMVPQQFSANGRAVIRKCFTDTPPLSLPIGHPKGAFSDLATGARHTTDYIC